MTSLDDARRVIDNFSSKFKPKSTQLFGVLGNGSGVVTGNRNNGVLVRIGGAPAVEVFNMRVPPIEGLPVSIGYDQNPNLMEVLDVDKTRITDWLNYKYVAPHGHSHTYGDQDSGYADLVYVQKRVFVPLICLPTSPNSLSVRVLADFYPYGTSWKYYSGETISLASYVPNSGYSRFATLYIETSTNTLRVVTGSNYSATITPSAATLVSYIPTPPEGGIPIASIAISYNTTAITEYLIYDVRLMYNSIGGTSTPVYSSSSLNPETLHANLGATPGSSSYPSRGDHRHAMNLYGSGIPSGIAYGPRRGVSPWASREDHAHHLTSGIVPSWAIATEAIQPWHIGSGVIKSYHLDGGISLGGSGTGHLHGLARWGVYSGLAGSLTLPDYAEYLESVTNLGWEIDPILYALSASGDKILFNSPFSSSGVVVSHYVIRSI